MSEYEKDPISEDYFEVDEKGRIIGTMRVDLESLVLNVGLGKSLYPGKADPDLQYFSAGQVVDRPENPSRAGNGAILDIPPGSYIWFMGERYPCDDGVAEIDTDASGPQRVVVQSFPEKNKVIEIEIDP